MTFGAFRFLATDVLSTLRPPTRHSFETPILHDAEVMLGHVLDWSIGPSKPATSSSFCVGWVEHRSSFRNHYLSLVLASVPVHS